MRRFFVNWIVIAMAAVQASAMAASVRVQNLRCEYLTNPLGIDAAQPRMSWVLDSDERGQMEMGYQILVASSEKQLNADEGDLWDSGRVDSDQSIQVVYLGKTLVSRERCFWKVRVWDKDGKPSAYSDTASWEMGMLSPEDWHGKWIAHTTDTNDEPAPLLRREFNLDGEIQQARAYICGLGYYELHINGKKIGDHILDPGYTRFDKRDLYVTYDVTDALKHGTNAVGVILGNGWFNVQTRAVWGFDKAPWRAAPKLLMELRIQFTDGRTAIVATDGRWKTDASPITFNSIYGGESYDARLELPNWDNVGFNDSHWKSAEVVDAPKGKLVAQTMPPIKIDKAVKPVTVSEPKPGTFVYDIGQNMAGFAEISVTGKVGERITMKYGERLKLDGTVDQSVVAQHVARIDPTQQFQTDTYTLNGKGLETWHSRFVYHGFQYVQVTGASEALKLKNLTAYFVHSAVPEVGKFDSSNPLIDKIWEDGRWSYLSNLQGIPTDCPHREKNGWTGDAHLAAEQGLFGYDAAAVYTKWINDLGDEQQPTGELPGIVPTGGWGYAWGNGPAWDSAFLLIPYYLYEYCGDTRVLAEHYDGFRQYVDYLTSKAEDGIVSIGLNDWAPAHTKTPADITSTAYYYRDALIVAKVAALIGNTDDAEKYDALAASIKEAFNKKFFHAGAGSYGNGSQTSLSCALYQGLVDPQNEDAVVANLVASLKKSTNHIDSGILGAKYLLNTLSDHGRTDVAYKVAGQRTKPSWGWWMLHGASTLWEQWDGDASRNHIMYGDILAWFYKSLAGINPDPEAPGFKHFVVKPGVVGDLEWAQATYNSMYGTIKSDWYIEKSKFNFNVTVPVNTTATVYLPAADAKSITEGGRDLTGDAGIKNVQARDKWTVLEVGSGMYEFSLPWTGVRPILKME